jgi:hypothetical protein
MMGSLMVSGALALVQFGAPLWRLAMAAMAAESGFENPLSRRMVISSFMRAG